MPKGQPEGWSTGTGAGEAWGQKSGPTDWDGAVGRDTTCSGRALPGKWAEDDINPGTWAPGRSGIRTHFELSANATLFPVPEAAWSWAKGEPQRQRTRALSLLSENSFLCRDGRQSRRGDLRPGACVLSLLRVTPGVSGREDTAEPQLCHL